MNTRQWPRLAIVAATLLSTFTLAGCSDGDGGETDGVQVASTRADGSKLTAVDREAADFVLSRLKEHWVKGPDGWTTRFQLRNYFGEVLPGDPELLFKQFRDFKYAIEPEPITDTMTLNGTDYRAGVTFEKSSKRYFRTVAMYDGPQGWSLWEEDWPVMFMAVERRNGEWLVSDCDLWSGVLPNSGDVPTGK